MDIFNGKISEAPKEQYFIGGFGNILFQLVALRQNGACPNAVLTQRNILTDVINWKIHEPLFLELYPDLPWRLKLRLIDVMNISLIYCSRILRLKFKNYFWSTSDDKLTARFYSGYFQDKNYLINNSAIVIDVASDLKSRLNVSDTDDKVVHFRWGDSTWSKLYRDYYEKVFEILSPESFTVVTDDISKLTEFINTSSPLISVYSGSALNSFKVLCGASDLYVAPSTFSWWAAQTINNAGTVNMPRKLFDKLGYYGNANLNLI